MRISDWSSDVCSSDLLIDFWLQGSRLDGLGLVEAIKAFDPTLPIIVISGHGGLDTAVAAIRRGAFDFIEKPFEAERLLHLVARATESERLQFEYERLREKAGQIGRASCGERVCQYVMISGVGDTLKKKKKKPE